ncbi:DUF4209 domain-containing protein [Conservatibacter flavescens]|nr:DUF4209 domain-containing protein [Conservatibacter flavescens]
MYSEIIESINTDISAYTDPYELMHYFFRNKEKHAIYQLLANVCSYQINADAASLSDSLSKGVLSNDLKDEDIALLDNIIVLLKHKELKAKIYHLLYLNRNIRKISDLTQAMECYFVDLSDDDSFYFSLEKLSLILLLGNLIRQTSHVSYINSKELLVRLLQENKDNNPSNALNILHIINKRRVESKNNVILWAEEISDSLISKKEYLQATLSLGIALDNLHSSKKEKISNINRIIADCYIKTARTDKGFRAAHFLLSAINTLAKIKDTRQERLELYEEMRDYQIESILDLELVETKPVNITPLHQRVEAVLNNSKDWFDMLFRTACCIANIAKFDELKQQTISEGQSLSDILFGNRVYIDHDGMSTAVGDVPSIADLGNIPEQEKQRLWSKIIERMKIHHQISCVSIVKAIDILNITYSISYAEILSLCTNNPFIPQGHEEFFAKGIYNGLKGDFLTANHLLVPQIENSLRHLLKLRAEEPTTLHGNNEQERDGLSSLLDNTEIIEMLGIDGVIHIRTILLDKRYPSLRHSIAHGFVDSNLFLGTGSIYMWWLILRFVMISYKDYWENKYMN